MVNDLDNWYITEEWAIKFRQHLQKLLPLAKNGNVLAQYYVAVIHMMGYCYTSSEDQMAHNDQDLKEMSEWLERAARQGIVVAVDNLITTGVGPEAERLRSISCEITKSGQTFSASETWKRAYGVAVSECEDDS